MLHPAAYAEFRQWQSRLTDRKTSWPILAGHYLRGCMTGLPVAPVSLDELRYPLLLRPWSSDLYVFEQIFVAREYDTPLETPRLIVDAGANIGLASVYFANRFPNAQIVAVEPEHENFQVLQRNARRYPNIRCARAALWSHPAELALKNADAKHWAFQFEEAPTADQRDVVAAVTIDQLSQRYCEGTPFDLVKIDIEGAEQEVFTAGGQWLSAAQSIIVECHDRVRPGCTRAVREATLPCGYSQREHGEYLIFERLGSRPAGGGADHG